MTVLALDGALAAFSTAIAENERIVASRCEPGAVALERGLVLVDEVLRETGIAPRQIDRVAVGVGPGSFTGLRIAIAYAKSLAAVWRLPLVPVDSFDLLEFGGAFEHVLTVVVGRPGVISARYRSFNDVRRASGRIGDVLDALFPPSCDSADDDMVLPVVGASEDVLHGLAERARRVRSYDARVTPAAAAAALAARGRTPPASLHQVRADYGELPAAKVPKFT